MKNIKKNCLKYFPYYFLIKIFKKYFPPAMWNFKYTHIERIKLFLLLLLIKIKSYRVVCLPLGMKVNYYRDDDTHNWQKSFHQGKIHENYGHFHIRSDKIYYRRYHCILALMESRNFLHLALYLLETYCLHHQHIYTINNF